MRTSDESRRPAPVVAVEDRHLRSLVARIRDEDAAALRELYDLTSARLLRAITQAGAAAHEDILVATYTRLWRGETTPWPGEPGVMHWLLAMAFAELVDVRRQQLA